MEKKQLGTTKAEWSVTSEWSADGCYFMTATTAPRLQVDNGYVNVTLVVQRVKYLDDASHLINEISMSGTLVGSQSCLYLEL